MAAANAEKQREAEAAAKKREQAIIDRKQRQAAWEARCQIKSVMTDEEIATCRQVWTRSAPL